jgi:hypothetical protein
VDPARVLPGRLRALVRTDRFVESPVVVRIGLRGGIVLHGGATPMNRPSDQTHEGPWLDRLFPIRLPGGRTVSVLGFTVLPTNEGILEGGLTPRANEVQRERILAMAKQRYGVPIVVLEPRIEPLPQYSTPRMVRERYPWMACIARLISKPFDPGMVSSELTLVWWQDAFASPLPVEIEGAAAGVDWERCAVDTDLP